MNTQKLKIDQIDPNTYNPNRMTSEQFEACTDEIKRHGDVLKPVVVRLVRDRYQIVDGEHSWRGAMAAGLQEITCQIVEIDDFEAMRQTLVRNEHGTHNPVREAMVYQRMMKQHQISNRDLAKLVGKSEATIRNRLKYLAVYERYEPVGDEDPIERIGSLTQAQIDLYDQLPFELRKPWIAAGANVRIREWVHPTADEMPEQRFAQIADSGLVGLISPKPYKFQLGVETILTLTDWAQQHLGVYFPAAEYLRPVMELALPVEVLDSLPRQILDGKATVLLPAEDWGKLLADCTSRASDDAEAVSLASSLVRRALRAAGIDPLSIASQVELDQHEIVLQAPELIRTADFLSLHEQFVLAVFAHKNPEPIAQEAMRLTVEHFRDRRTSALSQENSGEPPAKVHEVLQHRLAELVKAARQASTNSLPLEGLVTQITSHLLRDKHGKPVVEEAVYQLMQARLESIPQPELVLYTALLDSNISSLDKVIDQWRTAIEHEA